MKPRRDQWAKSRRSDGTVDFDALPDKLKSRYATEDEWSAGRPLSPVDVRRHERAGLHPKRGRPRIGEGAVRIQANVEASLLRRVDRAARAQGVSRSRILCEGAKLYLARVA